MTCRIPLLEFDAQVQTGLTTVSPRLRSAFALACAERLFATYERFVEGGGHGDVETVRRTLDAGWACAIEDREPTGGEAALVEACAALIPSAEDAEQIAPWADDALAAAAYALASLIVGSDPASARWAITRGLDALDAYLLERDDLDLDALETDERIWADPLVQAERARRTRDVAAVRGAGPDEGTVIDRLRASAIVESTLPVPGQGRLRT